MRTWTNCDFATCTMDLSSDASTEGSDCRTDVRTLCSVEVAGNKGRKMEVYRTSQLRKSDSDHETYNRLIVRGFQALAFGVHRQDLLGDGVTPTVVAILNVLVRKFVVDWHFVSKRALRSTRAFSLDKERTYMRSVSFVVGVGAGELL